MLAESLGPLGPTQLPKVLDALLPLLLKLSTDKEEDVQNNAVFGLGELARHGKEAVIPYPFLVFYESMKNLKKEKLIVGKYKVKFIRELLLNSMTMVT